MIGKYIHQFGIGWEDVREGWAEDETWRDYSDLFIPYFNGTSPQSKEYIDLRHDANTDNTGCSNILGN